MSTFFYRAARCRTCGVKRGLGDCEKCKETAKEVAEVRQAMEEQAKRFAAKKPKGDAE